MAEKKTAAAPAETEIKKPALPEGEEYVEIELFYDGDKYKDDVFVQVNGKSIQIKRGKKVRIKRKYAWAIENSLKQSAKAAELMDRKAAEFRAASRGI